MATSWKERLVFCTGLVLATLLAGASTAAERDPEIPVYELRAPSDDPTAPPRAYLVGSTHSLNNALVIPSALGRWLRAASRIAVENTAPSSLPAQPGWMDARTEELLREYLARERAWFVDRTVAGYANGPPNRIASEVREKSRNTRNEGLDKRVRSTYPSKLRPLENGQDRANAYAGVSNEAWNAFAQGWLLRALGRYDGSPLDMPGAGPVARAMRVERTKTFVRSILDLVAAAKTKEKPFVTILGERHFPSELHDGLVELLRFLGYRLRKVDPETGEPVPEKDEEKDGNQGGGNGGSGDKGEPPPPSGELSSGSDDHGGGGGPPPPSGGGPPRGDQASGGHAGQPSTGHGPGPSASVISSEARTANPAPLPDPLLGLALAHMELAEADSSALLAYRNARMHELNPSLPAGFRPLAPGSAPVGIGPAVAAGRVGLTVQGTSSVESVVLQLTNADAANWQTVVVTAGQVFQASDGKSQNMAAR